MSLLELAGLVGDAVLGGVLLGLPRVCSSGWEHARRPSESKLMRWTERLGPSPVGIHFQLTGEVAPRPLAPTCATRTWDQEHLLKLKWA